MLQNRTSKIYSPTKTIYRVENPVTEHGMWYDNKGIFEPIIHRLCPNGISKNLPMEFNPDHKRDGKDWFSAGKGIDNMQSWFSYEDIHLLLKNGFNLYEIKVSEWQEKDCEVLFTREGITEYKKIPISDIWK